MFDALSFVLLEWRIRCARKTLSFIKNFLLVKCVCRLQLGIIRAAFSRIRRTISGRDSCGKGMCLSMSTCEMSMDKQSRIRVPPARRETKKKHFTNRRVVVNILGVELFHNFFFFFFFIFLLRVSVSQYKQ